MENKKRIVLCGGGTAGHVFPALAVAEKLGNQEIHFFGGSGMEKDILQKVQNITYHEIPTVKFERKITMKNLLIPFKLAKSIKTTRKELEKLNPSVIFSKGGYVCLPVVFAAKKLGIPIISHESDLSFGLANKLIYFKCTTMCTTFEETGKGKKKCVFTGQPIREKIFQGKKMNFPNFDKNLPTLLVLGGSLGAKFLNDFVYEHLDEMTKKFNIIQICGKKNVKNINHKNHLLMPFAENIEDYYASCDLVLSRAGSGVINELLCLSKPMLLIPLSKKASRGDQIENAKLFEEKGYAKMLLEEDCSFEKVMQNLESLQKNAQNIEKNMKKTVKNDASSQIAKIIMQNSK